MDTWRIKPRGGGVGGRRGDRVAGGGAPPVTRPVQLASWLPIGSRRIRLPVAAKIALHKAGAKGGSPGSPTPLDGTAVVAGMMCTRVISGASSMRATWKPSKLFCWARPSLKVISPYLAMLSPITAAPSICERMRSGLAAKPQSIAVSTRGTASLPLSSTATSTTVAT